MNISFAEKRDNYAKIVATIEKSDYQDKYKAELKKYAQRANIAGFRKGKAPASVVQKMLGDSFKLDIINDVVAPEIFNLIKENHSLGYLGQPMILNEESLPQMLKQDDLTMEFEIALIPEAGEGVSSADQLTYYKPIIDDEKVSTTITELLMSDTRTVELDSYEDKALVRGDLAELDGDVRKEDGLLIERALIFPEIMKDEAEKNKFTSASKGDLVIFNPYKAFAGNEAELASMLRIAKEEVENYKESQFSFQIISITAQKAGELDQEFFDKAFPEQGVTTEEGAKEKIKEQLQKSYDALARYKFGDDFSQYIKEHKIKSLQFDEEVLRRWISTTESGKNIEQSADPDATFKGMIEGIQLEVYLDQLANKYDVKVTDQHLRDYAIGYVQNQFAQMGWHNAPQSILEQQAERILKDESWVHYTRLGLLNELVADKIRVDGVVSVTEQETSATDLDEMMKPMTTEANTESEEVASV